MASASVSEVYDLLILVDATASMSNYLAALRQSLPQIISISALTNCFERIGLLAYRDYCDNVVEWCGWLEPALITDEDQPNLVELSSKLVATGGGDWPEATKTGLAEAYKYMRSDATTLILLYTDAPPHVQGQDNGYSHAEMEKQALSDVTKGGKHAKLFIDWCSAAHTLRSGEKKAQVISLLDRGFTQAAAGFYTFLSAVTGGATLSVAGQPSQISQTTVEVLLAWMGVHKAGVESTSIPEELRKYRDTTNLLSVDSEAHKLATDFFPANESGMRAQASSNSNVKTVKLSTDNLSQHLPKKRTPLQDFSKTYKESGAYRALVVRQLREILERDVSGISLNPVFGSLWRTFCNDRENEHRQLLIDLFGRKVESIRDASEKTRMKLWLEESYDYSAEVEEAIAKVPASQRFPAVCLDPTLTFVQPKNDDLEDETENRPITAFRRDELLEIGRSCDWRILRRLGHVLTRLTFIESEDTIPTHIRNAPRDKVPLLPMALASEEYGRRFWNILLHTIVPGTMLAARPAALVAALAIKMGMQPLIPAAEKAMLFWKDKWNNIEVPETWSVNCLSLILDVDKIYRNRHIRNEEAHASEELLLDKDKLVFQRLVDYKMLENNLRTTLTAQVGWTPYQTTLTIGPVVICKVCEYPRSVTIMGPDNVCGICLCDYETPAAAAVAKSTRVTKTDDETSKVVWYECSVPTCRVQYVVYNVELLNVRPKCHYCRQQGTLQDGQKQTTAAPLVECTKCLSRMIWPDEYRPSGVGNMSNWTCVACTSGVKTVVDVETSANSLREENGDSWLLRNDDNKLKAPFNGRTLYHTASTAAPLDDLVDRVEILPARGQNVELFVRGKLIRNSNNLVEQLQSWIKRRRSQGGTCSLCFSDLKKHNLLPACGRSGCSQRICNTCLNRWYGLNGAGCIINTAALNCPFCRRTPTTKTLAKYGLGIHAVGDLRAAAEDSGMIYAWCRDCGYAREYMERVCAAGAPPDVRDWNCDDCKAKTSKVRKIQDCPSCGTPTEKRGGCDHIRCTVTGCGAHWCWFCGKQSEERHIYDHMRREHGGYYGGEATDPEHDEEDEEDEEDYL